MSVIFLDIVYFYISFFKKKENREKAWLLGTLVAHLLFALLFMWVYQSYYRFEYSDSFHLWQHLVSLAQNLTFLKQGQWFFLSAFDTQWIVQNGLSSISHTRYLYALQMLLPLYYLCGKSYVLATIFTSVLSSLIAFVWYYRAQFYFTEAKRGLLIFLFSPSLLFWSSGFSRDFLCLSLLWYLLSVVVEAKFQTFWKARGMYLLLVAASFYLLLQSRFYVAASLFPCLCMYGLFSVPRFVNTRLLTKLLMIVGVLGVSVWIGSRFHYNLNLLVIGQDLVDHYENLYKISLWSSAQTSLNTLQLNDMSANFWFYLASIPRLLGMGLFQPLWEGNLSWVSRLASLENTLLLGLSIWALMYWIQNFRKCTVEVWLLLLYVGISCCLITLVTPNLGTLHRYRCVYLCFYEMLVLMTLPKGIFRG